MKTLLYITLVSLFAAIGTSCTKKIKPNYLEGKWKVIALEDSDNPEKNKNKEYFDKEPMTFEFLTEENIYGQKEVFVYKEGELVLCYYDIINNQAIDMSDDETGREARAMLVNRIDNKTFELRKAENTQTLKIVRQ